ncbi:MAG: hypothetical protein N3E45_13655 [Oscillatoriaceae bacterium SKW80]|nr:hypothetical protein [Oscillatoriaceae bacterium SKYG93]MCX8121846.1 hypothetical protein [Oscillatoriaceae bacterium SKW80]MDW8454607.1 hypothetical protein [Oscillatoriaceae cyanobacterium SKYGB_i_bin93]HIK27417.1 hypothetical protein [Oscillatoriaceae cyanobacterium M7585_C2015_266]
MLSPSFFVSAYDLVFETYVRDYSHGWAKCQGFSYFAPSLVTAKSVSPKSISPALPFLLAGLAVLAASTRTETWYLPSGF